MSADKTLIHIPLVFLKNDNISFYKTKEIYGTHV